MRVVESCEWVEEYLDYSPVDKIPFIELNSTVSDISSDIGCEPIDIVGSHLFVDGVSFTFKKVYEGNRMIKQNSMNKPYMYQCVLRQLLTQFSLSEIATKCDVNRVTIKSHAEEQGVIGKRRTSWDVESSWEVAQKKTIERDGECVSCGISNEEHIEEWVRPLTAHHVVPREMFDEKRNADSLDNLVALCCEFHQSHEVTPRKLFLTAVSVQNSI